METTPETEKPAAETPAVEKPVAEASAAETPAAASPAAETPKKKSPGRRILKGLLWTVCGLLAFVVVAVLTLPLWINPVGTSLANALVPGYTGTAFNLERLNLNPYTGKLLVSGVKLANPEGYAEKDAFSLGLLSVDVEVSSLLSGTIHVRDVTIDSPYASYVFDAAGSNNFDRIIAEVNRKLGPKKKKEKSGETKVVVDKVTIRNVRAAVGSGAFELATLTLADFGRDDAPAKIEIAGVKLVNPKGFPEPDAFSLKSLSIGLETGDLAKKPMVFHDILVDSTYVGLVYNDAGESNFDVILKPFKGDEKKDAAASEGKKDEKKKDKAEDDTPHVVIDKLDIAGTKVQYRKLTLPVPLPTFTDIGKNSKDGASMKEVADQVWEKAKGSVTGLGDLAGALGGALGGGVTNLVGSAGAIVGGGVSNVLSGASNVLGGASNVLSGAQGAGKSIGESAQGAGKALGEGAKNLGEGAKNVGKALGEGAKNLGEGAKGAVEGVLKKVPNPFGK